MELRGVLSLCLLAILAGVTAEPQCVLFVPGLLKSGELGKACLAVTRHTQPVDVNISIEVNGTQTPIFKEQIPPGHVFKCSNFQVPTLGKASPVFILVNALSVNYNYTNRQPVVISPKSSSDFIRTDKYNYKGGQTVHITIFRVDDNLQPMAATFSTVYVRDPNGNRVQEWKNQKTSGSFLNLQFPIIDDPELGSYQIVAETPSGASVSQSIMVANYALPRYSVDVKAPSKITILDKKISFEVSGQYTYGPPVPGRVSGTMCRPPTYYYVGDPCNKNPDGICVPFTGEISSEGSYKGSIDVLPFGFERSIYAMNLILRVTLTEQGTGVQITETRTIVITNLMGRGYFDDKYMLSSYKRGLPYPVTIKVEDGLGKPQSNQTVELQVNGKVVQNLTSDENGKAQYEVDTSEFATPEIQLQLIYKNEPQCYDANWVVPTYSNDYRSITRFFSGTQTFVQIEGPRDDMKCGATNSIRVRYIVGDQALKGETTTTFSYMFMSRAKIVASGNHVADLSTSRRGEFNLTYTVLSEHVPTVECVVFNFLKDELVADTARFSLEKCFRNKVALNFSKEMGIPGSNVDLKLKATPASVCVARVFDSSLLLMDQGQPLTPDRIYTAIQYPSLNGYYFAGFSVYPSQPPCVKAEEQTLYKGMYCQSVTFPQEQDPGKLFQAMGLIAVTNTSYQQAQLCSQPFIRQPTIFGRPGNFGGFAGAMAMEPAADFAMTSTASVPTSVGSDAPEIVSTRTTFPEMWTMQLLTIGGTGSASQTLEVPGTITTWNGDMICVSNNTGFGMTKNLANFTSFQQFFVDGSLPNSIVRGETLVLIANVANYMDKCVKVQVSLAPSNDFTAQAVGGLPVKCICSKERATYTWNVNATSLGMINVTITAQTVHISDTCDGASYPNEANRKDILVRSFFVEAEGVKQDVTQTNFICVKGGNSEVVVNINPSGNIVPGSLKANVQVIGDLLGSALVKPEALYREPTGCGEQTNAALLPIPLTIKYLNSTGGLTEDMKEKGKLNMAIGYTRLVRFINSDGSVGTFGQGQGSSWLTVKVLKTLTLCKPFIMVEDRLIQQAQQYLSRLQDFTTGCFKPAGTRFNDALRGGANDDISFTCAVVTNLLENPYPLTPTLVRPALDCLEKASYKEQSVYNTIMLLNAFKAAGNTERANAMAEKVKAMATVSDGTIHWETPSKPNQQTPYLFAPPATSSDIEMTAYALMGFLYGKNPSTISVEDRNYAVQIVLWLVQWQTKTGCYRSTSDTAAVLEAIVKFAPFIYMSNASNTVQLTKESQVIREFNIDSSNRFRLYTERLTSIPGQYKLTVSGNGCVLVQTGVEFNVQYNLINPAFLLSLTTSPSDCKNGVAYSFDIKVNASYQGTRNTTNMVLIALPYVSGYTVSYDSLTKLGATFPKVETKNDNLILYLSKMDKDKELTFSVTMEMSAMVNNFQDKTCRISDYYNADDSGSALVKHPCTLHS